MNNTTPSQTEMFGVRAIFSVPTDAAFLYEERVTLWWAQSMDDALELAANEATEYASTLDYTFLGLLQGFRVAWELAQGVEVFSLMRRSHLTANEYVDHFFDTGQELQREAD